MTRRTILVALVTIASTVTAMAPAARAGVTTTWHVNNTVACIDSTVDSTLIPYCVIQAAVDDAASGDTIQIGPGIYSECGVTVVDISSKNLTIDGAGQGSTFIDPMNLCGGVRMSTGDLVMSDLTVQNGSSSGSGGGVTVQGAGSDLDLTDVTIKDGTATVSGAGILVVTGTTADLLRVVVSGNVAGTDGGGMDVFSTATVTVTDSEFTMNDATTTGGAIDGNDATITIDNTTFDTNTAVGNGGAIHYSSTSGRTLGITDSTFTGNEASDDGGGIFMLQGMLLIDRSLFTLNVAANSGGGIAHDFTETATDLVRVSNTTFYDNAATAGSGGGAFADGYFINTTFAGNSAGDDGGGLARNAFGTVNVANSIFAQNTAGDVGPECDGVWSEGHNLVLSDPGGNCIVGGDTTGNITGVNPFLLPLADNGGPTMSMAIPLGSMARNAGNPDPFDPTDWDSNLDEAAGDWSCSPVDQRGTTRTDGRCDLGAFEFDRVIRYAGANRYATAAAISAGHFPGGAATVVIATGLNFPDALAGAAWANIATRPLLLVDSAGVPAETAAELARLSPTLIIILGGPSAIPESVETTLQGYATTLRIYGANRYATAIAISQEAFPDGTAQSVLIATGFNFPDALAAGAAANDLNAPLLLVPGNESALPQAVAEEIIRLGAATIVVVGGPTAVSEGIYDDLDALQGGDAITRVFGANRYATAVAISEYAFGVGGASLAYIATGLNFPDALAGAAAAIDGPVLLVPGTDDSVPGIVESELIDLTVAADGTAVILGGAGVVSAGIETSLNGLLAV